MAQTSVSLSLNGDRQTLVAGNAARARGDWSAAAAYYDRYLRARPNHFAIWVQLGHALKEAGQRVESLVAYSRALALDDTDADLLLSLGHLHKLMGHRDLAIHYYRRSAEADSNVHALNELRALGLASEVEAAPALSERASPPTPAGRSRTLARLRALARRKSKRILSQANQARDRLDWPTAARQYRLYLKGRPEDFAIWVQLGHALKESGQFGEALGAYGQALSINPTDADLQLNLGHLHKLMGHRKTAIDYYKKSVDLDQHEGMLEDLERLDRADQPSPPAEHHARVPTPIEQRRRATLLDIERRLFEPLPPARIDGPLISILTPVYNIGERWLRRMAASVLRQSYQRWELILVDDGSPNTHVREVMTDLAASDPRIIIHFRERNGGISAATNDALRLARGEYVALLDNDDMLTSDALEEMVKAIGTSNSPDWLYSDEFKLSEFDRASDPFAKPDWSPFMLLNSMYTGHLTLYKTQMVRKVGGFRSEYDFSQDYDLALRISELSPSVVHVAQYLYGWRMIAGSAAQGDKPDARRSNIAALQDAINRRGWDGEAVPLPAANRVVRPNAGRGEKVSIIIPSDNPRNIQNSIASILESTTFGAFEIIVVTNSAIVGQLQYQFVGAPVIWANYDKKFNFSDKCNVGADLATGKYIIFFNDDVRVVSQDWVESILEYLTIPSVGAVGLKLLYENGTIQHAGMVTGVRRLFGTAFHCLPSDTADHANMAQCVREVSLICGALLAMPRSLFRELNGFDAINTPIYHSDVDLCLRVREAGYSCIYSPHATLLHIGHVSLAAEDEKEAENRNKTTPKNKADIYCLRRFGKFLAHDPYFPPGMRDQVYYDSQEDFTLYSAPIQAAGVGPDILIISHDLTNSGAPRVAYDMAVSLKEAGSFVVVMAPSDGAMRHKLEAAGVTVIVDSLTLTAPDWLSGFARNFDKVICNTAVTWRVVAQLHEEVDLYWYIHETGLIDELANSDNNFKEILAVTPNVLATSSRTGKFLSRYRTRFELLETGVADLRTTCPVSASISDGIIKIGLFGSFEERKGQDIAAHAFSSLPDEIKNRAELNFFGRSHDLNFEREVRRIWSHEPNIKFNGEADHPDYFYRLAEMEIVIVPSRDEPFSIVGIDALALGKPIVCSSSTGLASYITDGVSGYIAWHNTADDLCSILKRIIRDRNAREAVAIEGRKIYESFFTETAFRQRLFARIGWSPSLTNFR